MSSPVQIPANGEKITVNSDYSLNVPDRPIIPFIEGDGTGVDITPVMKRVLDAAVEQAYDGKRQIQWMEVYAGEKATRVYGGDTWLPDETVQAAKDYVGSIKGPLTTPTSGGIRSLNVALRQMLDLYVCLRPVRYFQGVPSPVKEPEKVDMVIFRENTEDLYTGLEHEVVTDVVTSLKVITRTASLRIARYAFQFARLTGRHKITAIHKANIMKLADGLFLKCDEAANRLGSWSGLMAQAGHASPADSFVRGDIKSARMFGRHVAESLHRLAPISRAEQAMEATA